MLKELLDFGDNHLLSGKSENRDDIRKLQDNLLGIWGCFQCFLG